MYSIADEEWEEVRVKVSSLRFPQGCDMQELCWLIASEIRGTAVFQIELATFSPINCRMYTESMRIKYSIVLRTRNANLIIPTYPVYPILELESKLAVVK